MCSGIALTSAPVSSLNSISVSFTDKVTFHAELLLVSVINPKNGSVEVTAFTCLNCAVHVAW